MTSIRDRLNRQTAPMGEDLPKAKSVNYVMIDRLDEPEPYILLGDVMLNHPDINEAEIGLAWRKNWKENQDGQMTLGQCVKVSDLQREFMDYDFIIVLNEDVWKSRDWSKQKKLALLDHELCHATVALDEDGMVKYNERGRPVYRLRKHDIEEFREVIDRHGIYKADLERFAESIMEARGQLGLFDGGLLVPGVDSVTVSQVDGEGKAIRQITVSRENIHSDVEQSRLPRCGCAEPTPVSVENTADMKCAVCHGWIVEGDREAVVTEE